MSPQIKECCEKAVITAKAPKARPTTAPAKMATKDSDSSAPKPVKRPGTSAPPKKPGSAPARKPAAAGQYFTKAVSHSSCE